MKKFLFTYGPLFLFFLGFLAIALCCLAVLTGCEKEPPVDTPPPLPLPTQMQVMETGKAENVTWIVLRDKSTEQEYLLVYTGYGTALTSQPLH